MKGRTEKESPNPARDMPDAQASWPASHERPCGGKHVEVQERSLLERVLAPENLESAWKRVKANKGAPGIDEMTIAEFPAFFRANWTRLCSALKEGTYCPAPVRRVFIAKPDGSLRPLGVPTVLDRVIQQALAQVLGPLFECDFSDYSYGYRPNRSAHPAARQMEAGWKERRLHAVDCDLKSFFDTVNHDRLMQQLRGKIRDRRVLALIRRYLQAGVVMPDGTREATPQGVPQGGPLSPLLANIVLDPLDKELERRGHLFARYADDFIVMVKSAKAAERVKESLTRFVERILKLVVNRTKTKSAPLRKCSFLGFRVGVRGLLVWTDKALLRFKQRVKEITSRSRGRNVKDIILELRRYVTGWLNYYGISRGFKEVVVLDSWIRRRVRMYYWKQWKQPRTRRRHLIALGIPPEETKLVTRSRKGYWRISENSILHRALNNAWLEKQGVPNFRKQWIVSHYGPKARV
jgi:RNA-directed DNA polymerase